MHPILQIHVKVNKGIRTIAPLGTWKDMIFSAEMDNAKNMDINLKFYEDINLNLKIYLKVILKLFINLE